jgi:hypothetical protein
MAASKLLANSDRWGDDAVMSRDLIDLAMMQPERALVPPGAGQGEDRLRQERRRRSRQGDRSAARAPHRLDRCMEALQITTVPKALLWKRIKALKAWPAESDENRALAGLTGRALKRRARRAMHRRGHCRAGY